MARVLYISYTGLLQPLGESQVFAYLRELAVSHQIDVISYERAEDIADDSAVVSMIARMDEAGIGWHMLRYHKKPSGLATLFDILVGAILGLRLHRGKHFDLVHCRSYVPAVIGLFMKRLTRVRFLFDMRGFWADERIDGGLWKPGSMSYRLAKWFERKFLKHADMLVSLTQAGLDELQKMQGDGQRLADCEVIPTCTDLDRFRPSGAADPADGFVFGYLGSAGSWYLFDQVLRGFADIHAERVGTRLLIINRGEHEFIEERLKAFSIPRESVELVAVSHRQVPELIAQMHAGIFLIKPVFSKRASAPTRLGEFLACGRPCLANAGVGDLESIVMNEGVGVCVENTEPEVVVDGLRRLMQLALKPGMAERCRAAAEKHFSLKEGARRYDGIYRRLEKESAQVGFTS